MRGSTTIARVALCFGVGALAAPAIMDHVGTILAERRVATLIGALPGVTIGRVTAEATRARLVIEDAVFSRPGTRVAIGRLVVPFDGGTALAFVQGARAQTGAVSADNIRIVSNKTTILIPHLEAKGTSLTSEDLAAIFDTARPMPAADRLARLTAASLSAQTVSILPERKDPAKTAEQVTFHDVVLTDVVAGKIGTLAIAGLDTRTTDGSPPPDTLVEVGRIGATALDLPLALTIVTGARTDAAASPRTLYGSISIETIRIAGQNPTGEMRIASVTSGGFRGRPLLDTPEHIEILTRKPAADKTDAERAHLAEVARDAIRSFALDRFEIRDFAFAQQGHEKIDFKVGRFALAGLDALKYDKASLDGFSLTNDAVEVTLGQFAISGYDQSALVDAMVSRLREHNPDDIATYAPRFRPGFDTASMLALHIQAPAENHTGNSRDGRSYIVDMPALTVANTLTGTAVDTNAHVQVVYAIPPTIAEPNLQAIAKAGIDRFDINTDYALTYDAARGELHLNRFAVDAKDLAKVTLGGQVTNVSADLFSGRQDPRLAAMAAQNIVLRGISLDVVNSGLVEKALPLLAASAGVSVPIMKAQLKGQAEVLMLQGLGDTPAAKRVTAALVRFIDDPKTLRFSIKAPAGLSVAEIAQSESPKALLDRVELDAVADQ